MYRTQCLLRHFTLALPPAVVSTLFLPMIMTVEAGRSEEEVEEEGMVTLGVGSREAHTGEGGVTMEEGKRFVQEWRVDRKSVV